MFVPKQYELLGTHEGRIIDLGVFQTLEEAIAKGEEAWAAGRALPELMKGGEERFLWAVWEQHHDEESDIWYTFEQRWGKHAD